MRQEIESYTTRYTMYRNIDKEGNLVLTVDSDGDFWVRHFEDKRLCCEIHTARHVSIVTFYSYTDKLHPSTRGRMSLCYYPTKEYLKNAKLRSRAFA